MKLKTKEMILFSLLGATMFVSKLITEALPNIHLLGLFIVSYTVVFRAKALIPIYVFVFLTGIYGGFTFWFADGGLFWGRSVQVTGTVAEGPTQAKMEG